VLVIGDVEHDGNRYLLIRGPSGGSYQIPEWMFGEHAATAKIISVPRFPVSRLIELRALADRLMATSPAKEIGPKGVGDERKRSRANGSVRPDSSSKSAKRSRPGEGDSTPSHAFDESSGGDKRAEQDGEGER
jgi:hypothetical protein